MIQVSIVIPSYNALSKIGRCIASLQKINFPTSDYEVVFVDDCSNDGTFEFLQKECAREKNWHVFQLENNSGSPSKPRNEGVKHASGVYIFYLDCDDEILPDSIEVYFNHAKKTNACIVRGNLIVDNGINRKIMNSIQDWTMNLSRKERIEKIISKQSTTITQLIKKDLLIKNEILWPEDIRMGEDSIFLIDVLVNAENIEYISHDTFIYNKMPALSVSSTQSYGKKELKDHIFGWRYLQNKLSLIGIDYSKIRLSTALQNVISSLIKKNKYDIDYETFDDFSKFIESNINVIKRFSLKLRHKEIIDSLLLKKYDLFLKLCRPRLLIAGHDLKFIMPAERSLEKYFDIRYDKWLNHTDHNLIESEKHIEWAEIIWCEWMLGNSVWYANNKKNDQKLIIRVHRQELATNYAEQIDFNKVDLVMPVSVLFFERLLEKFNCIPRKKLRLLSNYVDFNAYAREWHQDKFFNLSMIGILPAKKNFHLALEILNKLRKLDERYNLSIFGKKPEELVWLSRNKAEMKYFEDCQKYIGENKLESSVFFKGHCDLKKELSNQKIGFVLSLSESVLDLPGFESFHLAILDGFASGGVGIIKRWAGCEYIFPSAFIKEDVDSIVRSIYSLKDKKEDYSNLSINGKKFLENNYSLENFAKNVLENISNT